MKLKIFIELLQEISGRHGENLDVVMADDKFVVEPVFFEDGGYTKVIITDEKV